MASISLFPHSPSPNTCTWNPNNFSCTSGSKSQPFLFCCHAKLRLPRISPHHSPLSLLSLFPLFFCSFFSLSNPSICYLFSLNFQLNHGGCNASFGNDHAFSSFSLPQHCKWGSLLWREAPQPAKISMETA